MTIVQSERDQAETDSENLNSSRISALKELNTMSASNKERAKRALVDGYDESLTPTNKYCSVSDIRRAGSMLPSSNKKLRMDQADSMGTNVLSSAEYIKSELGWSYNTRVFVPVESHCSPSPRWFNRHSSSKLDRVRMSTKEMFNNESLAKISINDESLDNTDGDGNARSSSAKENLISFVEKQPDATSGFTFTCKEPLSVASNSPDDTPFFKGDNFNFGDRTVDFCQWQSQSTASAKVLPHASLSNSGLGVFVKPTAKKAHLLPCNAIASSPQLDVSKDLYCSETLDTSLLQQQAGKLQNNLNNSYITSGTMNISLDPFIGTSPLELQGETVQNASAGVDDAKPKHSSAFYPLCSIPLQTPQDILNELNDDENVFDPDCDVDGEDDDLSQHFELYNALDDNGCLRKWIKFKYELYLPGCSSRLSTSSPYDLRRVLKTPKSPWPQNLPKISALLSEEIQFRNDIWTAWREVEETYLPNPHYFQYQELNPGMRMIIVNWMMETSTDMKLHRETFQLALNYLDRFYSITTKISNDLHQIVAAACLFIASKKEEIQPPPVKEIIRFTGGNNLSVGQFNAVELAIVQSLHWRLTPPTYFDWLCLYMRKATMVYPELFPATSAVKSSKQCYPPEPYHFRLDIFRDALQNIDIFLHLKMSLEFTPSVVSAAAFYVACECRLPVSNDPEDELQRIEMCTGYSLGDINDCINCIRVYVLTRRDYLPAVERNVEISRSQDKDIYQDYIPNLDEFFQQFDTTWDFRHDEDFVLPVGPDLDLL
ncbi:hypothetical protein MP228_006561 [Amoeboaphelidium protococcarum]|nr:hypothetical protein MP228_006561 [Amoeboaphelidium protococcarum]